MALLIKASKISHNVGTFDKPIWQPIGIKSPGDVFACIDKELLRKSGASIRRQRAKIWKRAGHLDAVNGLPRDWSMPDDWHRGYLCGKLEQWKMKWADVRNASRH